MKQRDNSKEQVKKPRTTTDDEQQNLPSPASMATSTHQNAAHAGATGASPRAASHDGANSALAAANDHATATPSSEERPHLPPAPHAVASVRPRKRAYEHVDGAKQSGKDRHGDARLLERDKRVCVEATPAASESPNRLVALAGDASSLERVELEVKALQAKYEESARQHLAVIQDTKQRVSDVLGKLEQLQRAGNLTAHELQALRQDYNRQIDAVLAKVDALANMSSQRTALNVDSVTSDEIHQLRDELAMCKDELTEMEPRRASVENEFFQRMERFSNQLDHVRLQMSKMEQDLLQENAVSRRSLENLLSRQMAQYRHAQGAENKRLRDEMDELRSDMCELLKEMHLLKERTKYLGREPRRGTGPSSSLTFPRYPNTDLHHSSNNSYTPGCTSYLYAPTQSRVPVHGDDELYCQHHHCPAGIPHGHAGVAHGPPIDPREPSPPRLTKSALLQASQAAAAAPRMNVPVVGHHDLPRFCPSPHYSSRSSSVSGRISATRDEHAQADDEQVDDKEIERQLLEKHRLFWISEGAGSVSQASLEPPTPKFPGGE